MSRSFLSSGPAQGSCAPTSRTRFWCFYMKEESRVGVVAAPPGL